MALLDEELMQSTISPTPRNQILGLLSDFIAQGYDPRRTQQMQGISKFLMAPEISQTLDRLSYDPSGRSLFTGAGGLGGTTRMRPEALDAALAVAPMAGPAARLAGRGAVATGRTLGPTAANMAEGYLQSQGLMPGVVPKGVKPPRMSAAEAQAAGYWHPIGAGKKLPIPISQMSAEREPVRGLMDRIIANPESMYGNAIIPLTGDRSIAGQNLLGIGGTRFETPVYLEGGYDFMRTHSPEGTVWASEAGRSRAIQNRIDKAAQDFGGDVFGVYSAMGPESMNFNVMMADSLLEQMKAGKLTKKSIKAFDKEVSKIRPEWKGVMSPEARQQLDANGALRQAFVDRMQLDEFQNAGFPNIGYTRYAITDPRLLDEPMYSSGLAISKMAPGSELVTNPVTPHKTYNTQLRGEYVGGLNQSVPMSVMYPSWFNERRAMGAPISGDVRSFDLAKPIQQTNQEWLDGLMNYLMRQQQTP
jgi:hypothetical protein